MRKLMIIIMIFLCLFVSNCSLDPIPNPGFRMELVKEVRMGIFVVVNIAVGSVTEGRYIESDVPPTGNRMIFRATPDSNGYYDVDDGVAPGAWFLEGISGWENGPEPGCNGELIIKEIERARVNQLLCAFIRFRFPFIPSSYEYNQQSVEMRATLNGISTTHGMPIFHFVNRDGKIMAKTIATYRAFL